MNSIYPRTQPKTISEKMTFQPTRPPTLLISSFFSNVPVCEDDHYLCCKGEHPSRFTCDPCGKCCDDNDAVSESVEYPHHIACPDNCKCNPTTGYGPNIGSITSVGDMYPILGPLGPLGPPDDQGKTFFGKPLLEALR